MSFYFPILMWMLEFLPKSIENKNHKASGFQGLIFEPSGHALPGAEEPCLVV